MKKILLLTIFAGLMYSQCDTYYADIDGDGDGAKSVWCSYTDLPHATGGNWEDAGWETNGCGTVGWMADTPAGHLTYGPYISTDPGQTSVTWNMLANGDTDNDGTQIATIDIYDSTSGELLSWQNINVNDFNGSMAWQDFTLSYYSSPDHVYEFRTWYTSQGGHLVLRYITHVNEDADALGAYETTTLCDGDDTSGWSLNDDDLMSLCAENSNDECWDCAGEWGGSSTLIDCCDMGDLDACSVACYDGISATACSLACESGDINACIHGCWFGNFEDCSVACESDAIDDDWSCQMACVLNDDIEACSYICESGFNSSDPAACSLACESGDIDACQVLCEVGIYDQAQCCVWEFGGSPNGDANEDTNVTVTDLVLIIDNILDATISDELICSSDINGDGAVDVVDIVAIIELIIN